MEIEEGFLTILTPEGEFLRAKRQNQLNTIGEEIHFFPLESFNTMKIESSLKNLFRFKPVWAVVAALLLFFSSFIPIYQNDKAYAYMSIDANPSIELGVNNKMQVITLSGFNPEGKKIISQLVDWRKKGVSELTQTIITEMKEEGFIDTNQQIIISTVRANRQDVKAEKALTKNIKKIKETIENQNLELTVLTATKKERKEAHQLGVSTGKYQQNKQKVLEKNKVETNKKVQEQTSHPAQKEGPQGQQKINRYQYNGLLNQKPENELHPSKEKSIPPGQIKKEVEKQLRQNQGTILNDVKKQYNLKQQSHDQTKKDNQNEKQQQHKKEQSNSVKQKDKQKNTHNQNNRPKGK